MQGGVARQFLGVTPPPHAGFTCVFQGGRLECMPARRVKWNIDRAAVGCQEGHPMPCHGLSLVAGTLCPTEGEENLSSQYKILQWNHRTIRELYRTVQVLRQQREDLGALVKEQMQRKGLA